MRKQLSIIAFIIISSIELHSQIVFENGYFINESNEKVECLIKNMDWEYNPTEFEYKLSPNETIQKTTIQNVKEFGINNVSKYIRAKINIDRSSEQLDKLSTQRNPEFQEELLFLKVLIEGQASLFLYTDGNLTRFFYKKNDSEISQLIYKSYLVDNQCLQNNYFKQQLLMQLSCEGTQLDDLKHIDYKKKDLEEIFIKYHECTSSNYTQFEQKQTKDLFNLNIRPGLNYSSLAIQNTTKSASKTDLGNSIGLRFAIEAEFILPFNKNKWGIIIEPTYQNYKSEKKESKSNVSGGVLISKVDYKSIELPIGVRHYFYLNDNSKLFTNISYVRDFAMNSSIKFLRNDGALLDELKIKSRSNFALGVGYNYKKRYSLEIRYNTNREVLSDYMYWQSDYNSLNVILGFSIF
jgi:hypothetical protein